VGILLLSGDSGRCADFVRHQIPGVHAANVFLGVLFLLARLPRRCVATASISFGLAIILRGTWLSGLVQCCDLSCASDLWRGIVKTTANNAPQPTPGSGFSSAARFTSIGPAWLSFFR